MRNKTIIAIIILLLTLTACGENKNSPEYITKQYLLAFKAKDWEKAQSYVSEETKANFDMFKSLNNNAGITDVKDIKCKVNNDHAACTFCCFNDSMNSMFSNTVNLSKDKKGKWAVHIPKEMGAPEENQDSTQIE